MKKLVLHDVVTDSWSLKNESAITWQTRSISMTPFLQSNMAYPKSCCTNATQVSFKGQCTSVRVKGNAS